MEEQSKSRRRHKRGQFKKNDPPGDNSGRHPPHLKGKQIGLFYAQRNKANRENSTSRPPKPLGTVLLSNAKKLQIGLLLSAKDTVSPDKMSQGENSFTNNFLNIVNGKLAEKLEAFTEIRQDPEKDLKFYNEMQFTKEHNEKYIQMQSVRQKLPSYKKKDDILDLIDKNQVVVISGETGCGKTTQVGQFILDHYIEKRKGSVCHILCTQPRRISAISVSERVAQERGENLGISVGFHIRLERKRPRDEGSIVFCTTGMVLKQMESDPSLSKVSHLILDEIHERDILSDLLLPLLKQILTKRTNLKLILMSATLNATKISSYFSNCPHITIPGFTYPVEDFYLEDILERTKFTFDNHKSKKGSFSKNDKRWDTEYREFIAPHIRHLENTKIYSSRVLAQLHNPKSEELNLHLILALLVDICEKEKDPGAILVFLPGLSDISTLNQLMEKSEKFPSHRYLVLPLHSLMPTVNQREVFDTPRCGVRKIILSTNIAETSITVEDVVFVVDCGRIKITNFDIETNVQTLLPEWVSLSNASQRRGRAGRVRPGVCFHLFSQARKMLLEQYLKPEILRTRLEDTILTIKVLQLGKIEPFLNTVMDPPDPNCIKISIDLLMRLNALDLNENLTPMGYHLAKLPMSPQMGRMILFGAIFSCLDPILSVAASLDFKDAFQIPLGKEKLVDKKKYELSNGWKSDHLLLSEALRRFEGTDDTRRFCWEYFLSSQTLVLLQNMKKQLMEYLYEMNFVPNTNPKCLECNYNSGNLSLVKAVICAGLYPNVAVTKLCKRYVKRIYTMTGEKVGLHPKSVLNREEHFESPILVYHQKLKSTSTFLHDATIVHPLPVLFFGDNFSECIENEHHIISVSGRLHFKCSESTNAVIRKLRNRLNWFLEYKVSNPGVINWNTDSTEIRVLRAIMELITSEDMGDMDLEAYDDYD